MSASEIHDHNGAAVEHAIKAGELLQVAKAKVKHGGWLSWLEENFEGSVNLAGNYMRLAANSQTSVNFNSIDSALKALATPRESEPADEKPPPYPEHPDDDPANPLPEFEEEKNYPPFGPDGKPDPADDEPELVESVPWPPSPKSRPT